MPIVVFVREKALDVHALGTGSLAVVVFLPLPQESPILLHTPVWDGNIKQQLSAKDVCVLLGTARQLSVFLISPVMSLE